MKITPTNLCDFFNNECANMPHDVFAFLIKNKSCFHVIVNDFNMSENHIGGDNVISIVNEVKEAIENGYKVFTWYGPETETLILRVEPLMFATLEIA